MNSKFKVLLNPQVIKFLIVGLCCAAVEFSTFSILINLFHFNYLISNLVAVSLAILLNYSLSRQFVFQKSKHTKSVEIFSFVIFSILAILLNQAILWLFIDGFKMNNVQVAKVLTIIIVSIFNFTTKKYIVFKE